MKHDDWWKSGFLFCALFSAGHTRRHQPPNGQRKMPRKTGNGRTARQPLRMENTHYCTITQLTIKER